MENLKQESKKYKKSKLYNRSNMASETELFGAIKELLLANGSINQIHAKVRAVVTESLREHQNQLEGDSTKHTPPKSSDEVTLINELIREYLEWNGYFYSASVLAKEAGMPQEKRSRQTLCTQVGVKDDDKSASLPLLFNIVVAYIDRIRKRISKCKKEHQ